MRFTVPFVSRIAVISSACLVVAAAASLGACSAGSTTDPALVSDGAGTGPAPDGGARSDGGSSGGALDPACKPDPTCDRLLCKCGNDTYMATDGVCVDRGTCDAVKRCAAACGAAGFTGGSYVQKACTEEGSQCFAAQPSVSCQCNEGYGVDTYAVCTKGYCSDAPMDACPKACADQGGWTCQGAEDCTPVICACKDGQHPVTGGSCQGSSCAPSSSICPSTCSAHGGWAGSGGGGAADAGSTGPKPPGAACVNGSECTPFDCTCSDGTTFNQLASCQNKTCATKAQTCNNACLGSGGWSGH